MMLKFIHDGIQGREHTISEAALTLSTAPICSFMAL